MVTELERDDPSFERRGVRVTQSRRPVNYVGSGGPSSFSATVQQFAARIAAGGSAAAELGGHYRGAAYPRVDGVRQYEAVYDDTDYSEHVSDANVERTLRDVYGESSRTSVPVSSVQDALGAAVGLPNAVGLGDRGRAAVAAQIYVVDIRGTDLLNVRLAGDYDAPIDPVA